MLSLTNSPTPVQVTTRLATQLQSGTQTLSNPESQILLQLMKGLQLALKLQSQFMLTQESAFSLKDLSQQRLLELLTRIRISSVTKMLKTSLSKLQPRQAQSIRERGALGHFNQRFLTTQMRTKCIMVMSMKQIALLLQQDKRLAGTAQSLKGQSLKK